MIRLLGVTASTRSNLSPRDLMDLQSGTAPLTPRLVVDIRTRRSFHRSHIPGSHNIPLARLVSGEPPEADLVLVGETEQQTSSAIESLHAQGYPRLIRHLAGGLEAWRSEGLPLEGTLNQPLLGRWEGLPWIPLLALASPLLLAVEAASRRTERRGARA